MWLTLYLRVIIVTGFSEIPDMNVMREYFQKYIKDNNISTKNTGLLSRHTTKCFTKLGKEVGFYVRAPNTFKDLTKDKTQYPNDGNLLNIDLVWIKDNPYHLQNDTIYDWHSKAKEKSEIALAFEYEATTGIVEEKENPVCQCDELWRLSFVMARVKVLVYPTRTNRIDHHIINFREAISNFGMQQQPNPEWRIFAIYGDEVIGKIISPL